jgi:hypothetical protein
MVVPDIGHSSASFWLDLSIVAARSRRKTIGYLTGETRNQKTAGYINHALLLLSVNTLLLLSPYVLI